VSRPKAKKSAYNDIKPGSQVTLRTEQGRELTGRAMMKGPAGWVLNLGGPYGTPGIVDQENFVRIGK
jgi:hypothetical protein